MFMVLLYLRRLCFVNCLGEASWTVLLEEDDNKDVVVGHDEMAQENKDDDQPGEVERVVDDGVDLGINGEGQEKNAVEDGGPEEQQAGGEEDRDGETAGGDASVDAVVHSMEKNEKGNGIVEEGGNRGVGDEGQGEDEEEGGEGNSEKENTPVKHVRAFVSYIMMSGYRLI